MNITVIYVQAEHHNGQQPGDGAGRGPDCGVRVAGQPHGQPRLHLLWHGQECGTGRGTITF